MPTLEKFNPSIIETLCRLGEISAAESDFINSEVEKILPQVVKENSILQKEFLKIPVALQRQVIKKFLGDVKDFSFKNFEDVRKVLSNNLSGVELPKKLRADLKRGKLTVVEKLL